MSLINGTHVLGVNPFTNGESYLNVLQYIAEVNAGFFHMICSEDYGDLLTFTVLPLDMDANPAVGEVANTEPTQEKTVAINTVKIRDNFLGQETVSGDSTGGILLIEDNPIAKDQTAREALITAIATAVNGLSYYPFVAPIADPALNCGDRIRLIDSAENEYETYAFTNIYAPGYTGQNPDGSIKIAGSKNMISASAYAQCAVNYELPKSELARDIIKTYKFADYLNGIVQDFSTILNNPGSSYVKYKKLIEGVLTDCQATDSPNEIWITSKETVDETTDVLRLNSAGVGYSEDGGETFKQAITGKGILASAIFTDSVTGEKFIAGTPEHQRIEIYTAEDGSPHFDLYDAANTYLFNMASTAANATITVGEGKDFETIQAAIDSLPMFINHTINIVIYPGTYNENVTIKGFAGAGYLNIYKDDASSGHVVNVKRFHVWSCAQSLKIYIHDNMSLTDTGFAALVNYNSYVYAKGLVITAATAVYNGISFTEGATGIIESCTCSNRDNGIRVSERTKAKLINNVGTGNNSGIEIANSIVYDGGGNTITGDIPINNDGGLMLSSKGLQADLLENGWFPVIDAWTYASATTINVPSGAANWFRVGDALKLINNTAKQFYIVGVADTLLTISGGTDFTLANDDITDVYYSHGKPVDFQEIFNYTPTFSASGSMTFTSVSVTYAEFSMHGKSVNVDIYAAGTTGGTMSNTLMATLPVNVNAISKYSAASGRVSDGGATLAGNAWVDSDTNLIQARKYDSANFTAGVGRTFIVNTEYYAA